eukprot:6273954-Prymnesium_polylepis.1
MAPPKGSDGSTCASPSRTHARGHRRRMAGILTAAARGSTRCSRRWCCRSSPPSSLAAAARPCCVARTGWSP